MEKAMWIDCGTSFSADDGFNRVYFGHETCQYLLPAAADACESARAFLDKGMRVTLMTPFLTDAGITATLHLVEALLAVSESLEVACSDWGLLYSLAKRKMATPVVGRLLSGQPVDPRLQRIVNQTQPEQEPMLVEDLNGDSCLLLKKEHSAILATHCRSVWVNTPLAHALLTRWGISRCEVSNTIQGLELQHLPGIAYSLHVSEAIVSVMRWCPKAPENLNGQRFCNPPDCGGSTIRWAFPSMQSDFFRRDNALYYKADSVPLNFAALPIDRLVYRNLSGAPAG